MKLRIVVAVVQKDQSIVAFEIGSLIRIYILYHGNRSIYMYLSN